MAKKKKYYVVWKGRKKGIFETWPEAQAQVMAFEGALYKSYPSLNEAELAFKKGPSVMRAGKKSGVGSKKTGSSRSGIIWHSLSVDAACAGNPGVMEYQGVDTKTQAQIFHQKFALGTNNIGEFLAIVHALALLQKQERPTLPIYTDSATAMAWVRNRKVKTTLELNHQTKDLYTLIDRAEAWLKTNTYQNPILKWNTKGWGEIPADFGRK